MSDYINKAQAVAQTIAEIESLGLEVGRELEQRIKNDYISQPPADVVEVVRCKDCKWRNKAGCALEIVDDSDKPSDDDYCSYGERKDNEEVIPGDNR